MPLIPIPYGSRITSNVNAEIWITKKCHWCSFEYAFFIQICGEGEATNFLWLNKDRAANKANEIARKAIITKLRDKNYNDKFCCPNCGRFSQEVSKQINSDDKNEKFLKSIFAGIVIWLLFTFAVAALISGLNVIESQITSYLYVLPMIIGLLSGILYYYKIGTPIIDPNSNSESRMNQKFSKSYPVLSRSMLEECAKREHIVMYPGWE